MDRYKLKYELDKRGITVDALCEGIHMSRGSYFRKCNGKSEFTRSEIQAIVDFLGLTSPMGIFFDEKVS
jgi:hypothetical protein